MFGKNIHHPNTAYFLQSAIFLILLIAVFAAISPYFLSLTNLHNILIASTVIGLMAFGATFVIASGGIDLSAASIMALAGVVATKLAVQYDLDATSTAIIAIATGAIVGWFNGALIAVTGAPSFIITLGMLSVARAIAYIISDGLPIYGLPDPITAAAQAVFWGIPMPILALILCGVLCVYWLHYTKFGIHTLILGDNPGAAKATGIPVKNLTLKIYALAGALAGLAGFIFTARTNSGDPTAGQNYELIAITAVIIGGANLFGGRATIIGTFIGILALGVLQNGLNLLAIGTFYQILFVGLVLLASAFLRRSEVRR